MSQGAENRVQLDTRLALRPSEAAGALGVSERTIRKMLPELPHTYFGTAIVIPVDALRQWLAERVAHQDQEAAQAAEAILSSIGRGPDDS